MGVNWNLRFIGGQFKWFCLTCQHCEGQFGQFKTSKCKFGVNDSFLGGFENTGIIWEFQKL